MSPGPRRTGSHDNGLVPSALAERLLALGCRDREWAESVTGDLREEFVVVARRRGVRAARRWHWGQTLRLTGRRVLDPLPPAAPRRRTDVSEPRDQGRRWAGFHRDVTYALRSLWRRPALTAAMVAALAIGLAANATIFTVLDALVLRPFRFPAVERLLYISTTTPTDRFDNSSVTPGDFVEWTEQARTLTDFAAYEWWEPNITGRQEPEQVAGFRVSASFFRTLGVEAARGRMFIDEDGRTGNGRRVVISHALWQRRFGGDAAMVGQTIRLDGEDHEVVGIARDGFKIPMGAEIWAPMSFDGEARNNRKTRGLSVVARLADGATIETARAEMTTIVDGQRERYPDVNVNRRAGVQTFTNGLRDEGADQVVAIWQVAALLLLLVACANVLNLLLVRGVERQQEFAVRLALGAGRGRIVRQLLLEGAMLAGVAVACSVPLAWMMVRVQRLALPASLIRFVPGWEFVQLDMRGLAITAALAFVATLAFSLAPAAQAARSVVADALRQNGRTTTGGRRRAWGRAIIAGAQVAVTLALLTGSALAIAAAHRATRGDLGFDPENVLVARMLLPNNPYDDPVKRRQFTDAVIDRMRALPAVQTVAMSSALPYGGQNTSRRFFPEGVTLQPGEVRSVDVRRVTPHYLDAMRIPLVAGRGVLESDSESTDLVAVVSQRLVERYWPNSDPLQRRFRFTEDGPWLTVVGVVGDVTHDWFLAQRNATVYRPARQDPPYNLAFVARIAGDPLSLAGDLRRAVTAADPNQPVRELLSMREMVAERTTGLSYAAQTLTAIGAIALLLALMGIYSLMSYLASQRTQEIGVRLAFGATPGDVVWLTLRQAMTITLVGLVAGLGLSLVLSNAMQAMMFGAVSASLLIPLTLAALLAAAAAAASYLPARRAAALDPTTALKAE